MAQILFQEQPDLKQRASSWFTSLRDQICAEFEKIENELTGMHSDLPPGRFERKSWDRKNEDGSPGGSGVMSVMRGRVFEKAGVNISIVDGFFSQDFRKQVPGAEDTGAIFATGIS